MRVSLPPLLGGLGLDVRVVSLMRAPIFFMRGPWVRRQASLSHARFPPFFTRGLRLDVRLVSLMRVSLPPLLGGLGLDVRLVSLMRVSHPSLQGGLG